MHRNVFGLVISLLVISTFAKDIGLAEMKARCMRETERDLKDPLARCFQPCIFREIGAVDANGRLNIEVFSRSFAELSQSVDKRIITAELRNCNKEALTGTTLCQMINKRMACVVRSPNIGAMFKKNQGESQVSLRTKTEATLRSLMRGSIARIV